MKWRQDADIIEMSWGEARQHIKAVDQTLVDIIDELSPNKNFTLFKVAYPFGAIIYENAELFLPTKNGKMLPVKHDDINSDIRSKLQYSALPLGVILNNGTEVFREVGDHVFSQAFLRSGLELGIWESFGPVAPYKVAAGARSLIMLPKITNASNHKKLKHYGISKPLSTNSFDQWHVFVEMANNKNFAKPWFCEVLFFSDKWFEKMHHDPAWSKFHNHVLKKAWTHTAVHRLRVIYDAVWEDFAIIMNKKHLKPSPYTIETFKHLVFAASGMLPAFKPVGKSQIAGPTQEIAKIYLEEYGLKTYVPTIMYADLFTNDSDDKAYYSLQIPTCASSIPKNKNSSTVRINLFELIDLMDHFMYELTNNKLGAGNPYIYDLFSKVQLDFFHNDADLAKGVHAAEEMVIEDPRLIYMANQNHESREFCARSSFVRGCVRMSHK